MTKIATAKPSQKFRTQLSDAAQSELEAILDRAIKVTRMRWFADGADVGLIARRLALFCSELGPMHLDLFREAVLGDIVDTIITPLLGGYSDANDDSADDDLGDDDTDQAETGEWSVLLQGEGRNWLMMSEGDTLESASALCENILEQDPECVAIVCKTWPKSWRIIRENLAGREAS